MLKPGSQYDARASVASRVSGWRWNRLDFYSSVASRALACIQPIRMLKNLMSGMQFHWWKKRSTFFRDAHDAHDAHGSSVILWTRLRCALSTFYEVLDGTWSLEVLMLQLYKNISTTVHAMTKSFVSFCSAQDEFTDMNCLVFWVRCENGKTFACPQNTVLKGDFHHFCTFHKCNY